MKSFNKYGFVLLIVFAGAASAQTLDQRKAAAEATAQSTTNYCGQIPPADPLNGIEHFTGRSVMLRTHYHRWTMERFRLAILTRSRVMV